LILSFEKISFRLLQSSKGHEKLKESFSNIGDTLRVIRMDTALASEHLYVVVVTILYHSKRKQTQITLI
jgi:hypothetical protein